MGGPRKEPGADIKYSKDFRLRKKREVLALYGSVCARCGFCDERALQIDHIKGHPIKKANEYGRGGTGLYIAIINGAVPKEDYQCLCANCNWIKRYENSTEFTHHKKKENNT